MELYLLRHGQTEENLQHILQGQMAGHLTPEGREQARAMGQQIAASGTAIDCIITSDLQRAVDSARLINASLHLPVYEEPLLRERDFGIHTGHPYVSISGELDPSAETVEQMFARAARWLHKVVAEHEGETVLAVSHGLFLRVIQGAIYNKVIRDIPRMENAEMRHITLTTPLHLASESEEVGATEN